MRLFRREFYWICWTVFGLGALAAPLIADGVYTISLLAFFLCVEGLAILDDDVGDTLSEQVWFFYAGKSARFNLVAGFTIYLVCAFLSIFLGAWLLYPGIIAVAFGLGIWLWDHFRYLGEKG